MRCRSPAVKFLQDKEWLYTEYIVKQRSMKDLRESLHCNHYTLQKWLDFHNILIRLPHIVIHNAWKGQDFSGVNNPRWKGGKSYCRICGKQLPTYAKNGRCIDCYNKVRHETHRKPPEACKTDESKIWRKRIEYKDWRDVVYSRDDYICQHCEATSVELNCHHILNFADHISERFDVDNGITLCKSCHKLFHKYYGKKNNTKQQISEFILMEAA